MGLDHKVLMVLRTAVSGGLQGVHLSMVVTEGRPDGTGLTMANALSKMEVPCTIVLYSAGAFALEASSKLLTASWRPQVQHQVALLFCVCTARLLHAQFHG